MKTLIAAMYYVEACKSIVRSLWLIKMTLKNKGLGYLRKQWYYITEQINANIAANYLDKIGIQFRCMAEFSSSVLKSICLFSSQYVFITRKKINQNTINNNANLNNQIDTAINPSRLVMRNNSSSNIDCEMILLWKKQIDNK